VKEKLFSEKRRVGHIAWLWVLLPLLISAQPSVSRAGLRAVKLKVAPAPLTKKLAVVIGINRSTKSNHWAPLQYAQSDAQKMVHMLHRQARFDKILLLTKPSQTTTQAIRQSLLRLKELTRSAGDTVFVYVSAHGIVSKGQRRFIVTSDTSSNVSQTGLSVTWIRKLLQNLPSRKICLILATCYTGGPKSKAARIKGHKGLLRPKSPFRFVRAIQILSAASHAQAAYESETLKADVYTHFFLDCLRKLKKKSIIKTHVCASSKTTTFVQKWNGEVQVPKAYSEMGANRDFLLVEAHGTKPKSGYLRSFTNNKKTLTFRVARLGKKSTSQKVVQVDEGELTAFSPGRYRVQVLDKTGKVVRSQVLWVRAGKVVEFLSHWSIDMQMGSAFSSGVFQKGGDWSVGGMGGIRHRYFALLGGLSGTVLYFEGKPYAQLVSNIRVEVGNTWNWERFSLFAGGYASVGLFVQDLNHDRLLSIWLEGGLTLAPAWRFAQHWSVKLGLDIALFPSPSFFQWRLFWGSGIRLGLMYHFGEG